MGELYSWFLNSARLGYKMLDALVHAAKRWYQYPAQLLYNIATAAYSSFATGRYMQMNPATSLLQIIGRYSGQLPVFGRGYSEPELVDMFGGLLDAPYSARGIITGGDDLNGSYHTVDSPANLSSNFADIDNLIKRVMQQMDYLEPKGALQFRLQFILGTPILVPIG